MKTQEKAQATLPQQAHSWEVYVCGDGHIALQLLDRRGKVFAEAHGFDRDSLVFALLTGDREPCCECVAEKLEELLIKAKSVMAALHAQAATA